MESPASGKLIRKVFTGEQTGSLVDFCRTYEEKNGTGSLKSIRVTVQGKDRETGEAERRIQGKILNYVKEGYIRNIAIEEDKTGFYFLVGCSTAKFERIAAKIIVLEYSWQGGISSLLDEIDKNDSEDELLRILGDLEIGLPSEISDEQLSQIVRALPKLLRCNAPLRKKAVAIVKQIRKPELVQYLLKFMNDDEPEIRQVAVMDAESLQDFFNPDDIERLRNLLLLNLTYPHDERTRIYAAEALGFIGNAETINYLSDRKYDQPDVQWASVGAIATILPRLKSEERSPERIRYDDLIDFLSSLAADKSKKTVIRETATSTLGYVMRVMTPYSTNLQGQAKRVIYSLVNQILHEESLLSRLAAVKALEDITYFGEESQNRSLSPLTSSMLPDLLSTLSSSLINPWKGTYCPIIDDICKVEIQTKNQCFIIFKYDEKRKEQREKRETWEEIITHGVKETGMTPFVARDLSKGEARGSHCTQICKPIRESRMCIADVSQESTSVGYEINLAWRYNRPVLITFELSKRGSRKLVPFDLQGLQIAYYRNLDELKTEVPKRIQGILAMIEEKRLQ